MILASIRLRNDNVALAIPSSEIAETLMDDGRTAHSVLILPLTELLCKSHKNRHAISQKHKECARVQSEILHILYIPKI
ncbi:hypothetical protein FWK35_00030359 [Aphis craccivora]|uniref:Uncharacterized protein n=1 Tax=Aphis craccivora TaxID=307492 RepID=A0A6G0YKG5_APHCR|nr:hypothetical protein FWK35_00030359 [Aphis craccivora]